MTNVAVFSIDATVTFSMGKMVNDVPWGDPLQNCKVNVSSRQSAKPVYICNTRHREGERAKIRLRRYKTALEN